MGEEWELQFAPHFAKVPEIGSIWLIYQDLQLRVSSGLSPEFLP